MNGYYLQDANVFIQTTIKCMDFLDNDEMYERILILKRPLIRLWNKFLCKGWEEYSEEIMPEIDIMPIEFDFGNFETMINNPIEITQKNLDDFILFHKRAKFILDQLKESQGSEVKKRVFILE